MTYNSLTIANYFLYLANRDNKPVSAMKLQKLVYYAHGWHLALTGKPLINEQVEAWRFGPVIPNIYHEFKHFGNSHITEFAREPNSGEAPFPQDESTKQFLDKIWKMYGNLTAIQLSNTTHEPGTPWAKTWGDEGVPMFTDIDENDIKEYFEKKLEKVSA